MSFNRLPHHSFARCLCKCRHHMSSIHRADLHYLWLFRQIIYLSWTDKRNANCLNVQLYFSRCQSPSSVWRPRYPWEYHCLLPEGLTLTFFWNTSRGIGFCLLKKFLFALGFWMVTSKQRFCIFFVFYSMLKRFLTWIISGQRSTCLLSALFIHVSVALKMNMAYASPSLALLLSVCNSHSRFLRPFDVVQWPL